MPRDHKKNPKFAEGDWVIMSSYLERSGRLWISRQKDAATCFMVLDHSISNKIRYGTCILRKYQAAPQPEVLPLLPSLWLPGGGNCMLP